MVKEAPLSVDNNTSSYYFSVVFEKGPHGYAVRVVGFEDILTSGDTLEEAEKHAREAISSHIQKLDRDELALYTTPPTELTAKVIEIQPAGANQPE